MNKLNPHRKTVDRPFLALILIMVGLGYFIFLSASLGSLGHDISSFLYPAGKQLMILITGLILMLATAALPYHYWRKFSPWLLIFSIILTILVLIPGLSMKAGGASRWLDLGFFTFQPAEVLKLGLIVYFAAWLATVKDEVKTFKWGLLPLFVLGGIATALLIPQPDTGTLVVIGLALVGVFFVAGARFSHLLIIVLIGLLLLGGLILHRPYIKDRLISFISPTEDVLGSSYQVNQSLIAIGSGQITGRGFGQSLQKFSFLPQPVADSIFAVAAEEFGFIGALILLFLFLLFTLWGLKIASRAPDLFGRLMVVGIVILIASQSFINMGAMMGILPLTGVPLVFVSHGGTSLLVSLLAVGIILNVSRH